MDFKPTFRRLLMCSWLMVALLPMWAHAQPASGYRTEAFATTRVIQALDGVLATLRTAPVQNSAKIRAVEQVLRDLSDLDRRDGQDRVDAAMQLLDTLVGTVGIAADEPKEPDKAAITDDDGLAPAGELDLPIRPLAGERVIQAMESLIAVLRSHPDNNPTQICAIEQVLRELEGQHQSTYGQTNVLSRRTLIIELQAVLARLRVSPERMRTEILAVGQVLGDLQDREFLEMRDLRR